MSECYKCGRELPGTETECEPECGAQDKILVEPTIMTAEQLEQCRRECDRNSVSIDWDKVTTLDDMKLIVRTMLFDDRVYRGSVAYRELRKFLKEKNPHD